jgi:UDP-N-acetylmuramoylalanine--D-glutamate ligase
MLSHCGFNVRLAGNIGRPLLDCDDQGVDWWVIELSSYQLADLRARPTVSLVLNLSSEHLDWHGSDEVYRRDKLRLAELGADGVLIANAADSTLRESLASNDAIVWFNADNGIRENDGRLLDGDRLLLSGAPGNLPGRHNLSNTAAALTVVRAVGADIPKALAAIPSFRALGPALHQRQHILRTGRHRRCPGGAGRRKGRADHWRP